MKRILTIIIVLTLGTFVPISGTVYAQRGAWGGGAVSYENIIANSIDSTKIINGGVGKADLQTGSVDSTKVGNGALSVTDIANGANGFVAKTDADDSVAAGIARDTTKLFNADVNDSLAAAKYVSASDSISAPRLMIRRTSTSAQYLFDMYVNNIEKAYADTSGNFAVKGTLTLGLGTGTTVTLTRGTTDYGNNLRLSGSAGWAYFQAQGFHDANYNAGIGDNDSGGIRGVSLNNASGVGWTAGINCFAAPDVAISRLRVATLGLGTGAISDSSGTLVLATIRASGTINGTSSIITTAGNVKYLATQTGSYRSIYQQAALRADTLCAGAVGVYFDFFVSDTDSLVICAAVGDTLLDGVAKTTRTSSVAGACRLTAITTDIWALTQKQGIWTGYDN